MLVAFGQPISFQSLFYMTNYLIFTPVFFFWISLFQKRTCSCPRRLFPFCDQGWSVRDTGLRGGGSCRWGMFCTCVRDNILAWNLLHQAEAHYLVPVRFPVPQGNRKTRFVDHTVVQPCKRNCEFSFEPAMYVKRSSLSSSAMSCLKVLSMTSASFLSIPSTERKM